MERAQPGPLHSLSYTKTCPICGISVSLRRRTPQDCGHNRRTTDSRHTPPRRAYRPGREPAPPYLPPPPPRRCRKEKGRNADETGRTLCNAPRSQGANRAWRTQGIWLRWRRETPQTTGKYGICCAKSCNTPPPSQAIPTVCRVVVAASGRASSRRSTAPPMESTTTKYCYWRYRPAAIMVISE